MKTIIISDLHLSPRLINRKFNYLQRIIQNADQVIINGDFWEGYVYYFSQFINSPWQALFPLLKAKNTIYIFGNHDPQKWMDKQINEFSQVQAEQIKIPIGNKTLVIQHGNQICKLMDESHNWLVNKYTMILSDLYCKIGLRLFKFKFYRKYYLLANKYQNFLRLWAMQHLNHDQILVSGHTHIGEIDLNSNYINSGFIHFGFAQYIEIDDEKIRLIEEKY
jgi:UDP-2,3-diacylglucosamine pyrophosphatase LpxH